MRGDVRGGGAVLPILRWPDARLRATCRPVRSPASVARLVDDMFATMYDAPGRGLAAPQVGVTARLFVMDATWKDGARSPLACINPLIEPLSASGPDRDETGIEACLSMPGIEVSVPRPPRVRLRYTDLSGDSHAVELDGAAARIAQHETDHLDGLMHFHRVSDATRADILAAWESLP